MLKTLATCAVGLGLILVVASWCWPSVARQATPWTEAQAHDYADAAATVHRLAHERSHAAQASGPHGHEDGDDAHRAEQFQQARQKYDALAADLEHARTAGTGTAAVLRWCGWTCALLGGLALLVQAGLNSGRAPGTS